MSLNENIIQRAGAAIDKFKADPVGSASQAVRTAGPPTFKKAGELATKFGKTKIGGQVKGMAPHVQSFAGPLRSGLKMARKKWDDTREDFRSSREFTDGAIALAESKGWTFDTQEDVEAYLDVFTEAYLDEMALGMASIGTLGINRGAQTPGGDTFPGLNTVARDGQRAGPRTDTLSGEDVSAKMDKDADIDNKNKDKKQTRGADSFPALSFARKDGQRIGPKAGTRSAEEHHPVKAESLHATIYNSLAGKRVRDSVNQGRSPFPSEIKQIAESEGFKFGNLHDVDNFMKMALLEKLFPSTGATGHANQMKGDEFPGQSEKAMDIRGTKKAPQDGTTGQNRTGARAAKDSGEAPNRPGYKKDGPKGSTQQFEKPVKVCPVCNQANKTVNVHCGACGCVLPPHPESRDGGVPANAPSTKQGRNHNVATDGGLPKVGSPYGGSPNKHHYLKKAPASMSEDIRDSRIPESPRMIIHDLLESYDREDSYEFLDENDIEESKRRALKVGLKRLMGRDKRVSAKIVKNLIKGDFNKAARSAGSGTGLRRSVEAAQQVRRTASKIDRVLDKGQDMVSGAKMGLGAYKTASKAGLEQTRELNKVLPSKRRLQASKEGNGSNMSEMVDFAPQGVHDDALKTPGLASVNSKAKGLGLNPITADELDRVVGMYQQGETVGKAKLYTGIDVRLAQAIADMVGIGSSHGITRGMSDNVSSASL